MTYPKWLNWKVVIGLWALAIVVFLGDWLWFKRVGDARAISSERACATVGSTPFAYYIGGPQGDEVMCSRGTIVPLAAGGSLRSRKW
jgi:hypothetical protein